MVRITGHVVGESLEVQNTVCAGKQHLPSNDHQVMEPGAIQG
jgi:hypothetical protein